MLPRYQEQGTLDTEWQLPPGILITTVTQTSMSQTLEKTRFTETTATALLLTSPKPLVLITHFGESQSSIWISMWMAIWIFLSSIIWSMNCRCLLQPLKVLSVTGIHAATREHPMCFTETTAMAPSLISQKRQA